MNSNHVSLQRGFFVNHTCEFVVRNSINANCSGAGRYVTKEITIKTKCMDGYFVYGSPIAKCGDSSSICKECGCSKEGSVDEKCADMTGKCTCKDGYHGLKCYEKDCELFEWGSWSR